jgi:RNA polymerase subunit RPABC4/transcription elongation factor Spt4
VRSLRKPAAQAAPIAACGKCGKVVQDDWKNCPYCGKKL